MIYRGVYADLGGISLYPFLGAPISKTIEKFNLLKYTHIHIHMYIYIYMHNLRLRAGLYWVYLWRVQAGTMLGPAVGYRGYCTGVWADGTGGANEGYGYGTPAPHVYYVPVPRLARHFQNVAEQCHAKS